MDVVGFFFVGVLAEGVDGLTAVELAVIDILRRTHNGDVQLAVTGADVVPVDEVDVCELAAIEDAVLDGHGLTAAEEDGAQVAVGVHAGVVARLIDIAAKLRMDGAGMAVLMLLGEVGDHLAHDVEQVVLQVFQIVRGKILNCLKADYERIFKSDIITDLIRVLGCGVEVQTKKTKDLSAFDLENLRWNKVIICTDADVDGYQIRTLILTMIYRLCPTLIQEGYVYIAESPLYEITCKDKTWFAYTDAEKTEIVKKLEGKKLSINRSKGLGENDPEMMWMTTMNPATRRLIKVMPEDMERTMQVFDLLLGDNLQGRKDHIAENGYKYLDQLDVS